MPEQNTATNQQIAEQAAKENNIVIPDAQLEHLSFQDMKRQYIILGKEFKNKVITVQALQRNFQVLSKLCQSEQEEKQKFLQQS